MGLLDFLFDGKKKAKEAAVAAPAAPVAAPSVIPSKPAPFQLKTPSTAQVSGFLSSITTPKVAPKPVQPVAPMQPTAFDQKWAAKLKGIVSPEILATGDINQISEELIANDIERAARTYDPISKDSSLLRRIWEPTKQAVQIAGDTIITQAQNLNNLMPGAIGLPTTPITYGGQKALTDQFLETFQPERLAEVSMRRSMEGDLSNEGIPGLGLGGSVKATVGLAEAVPLSIASVRAVSSLPFMQKLQKAGAAGKYAASFFKNIVSGASVSAMGSAGEGKPGDFSKLLLTNAPFLLPTASIPGLGVLTMASYLGNRAMGQDNTTALTNSLMGLAASNGQRKILAQDLRNYRGEQFTSALKQMTMQLGPDMPTPVREAAINEASALRAFHEQNPTKLKDLYQMTLKAEQRIMKLSKSFPATARENRMIGMTGSDADVPANKMPIPAGTPMADTPEQRIKDLTAQYGSEDDIPLNAADQTEFDRVAAGGGWDEPKLLTPGTTPEVPQSSLQAKVPEQARLPSPLSARETIRTAPTGKTLQKQLQMAGEAGAEDTDVPPWEKTIQSMNTPVEKKVHLLDYFATPENTMKKTGVGKEMYLLRKADEAYRREVPEQIDQITQWKDRTAAAPDATKRIFRWLNGDKNTQLSVDEMGVANEMRGWYLKWAGRLGLEPQNRISDYVSHVFDMTKQQEFDEDLAKLISDKVPKEVFNPFMMQRKDMPGFIEDAFLAAEVYAKRATRKVHLDPALAQINKAAEGLEEKTFNYVRRYIQEVNLRPVETDVLVDNLIKSTLKNVGMDPYTFGARPTNVLLRSQRRMIYRGLIGGNVGSAVRNLTQGVNTFAELGTRYTTIGYTNLLKELFAGRATQELQQHSVLGTDISQQDRVISAGKKLSQAADDVLFSAFNLAETINRGSAYYGAKAKYMDLVSKARRQHNVKINEQMIVQQPSLSDDEFYELLSANKPNMKKLAGLNNEQTMEYVVEKAKEIVRKTQFQFGPLDAPLIMRGDLAKSALQLQGFTMKQAEFLANKILVDKDVGFILRYTAASLAVLATVGKVLGFEGKDFLPGVRFLEDGSIPPMFQLPVGVAKAIFNVPDKYGRRSEDNVLSRIVNSTDVQRGAMMYVPGGAQMQKSIAGIGSFISGEKRSASGKSQTFPIEQNLENLVRAFTYGPYGTREGRDYIQEEIKGPGLLDRITGATKSTKQSSVPKSKYALPKSGGVPKSKYSVPKAKKK